MLARPRPPLVRLHADLAHSRLEGLHQGGALLALLAHPPPRPPFRHPAMAAFAAAIVRVVMTAKQPVEADHLALALQAFERALDRDVLRVADTAIAVVVPLDVVDIGGDVVGGGRRLALALGVVDRRQASPLHPAVSPAHDELRKCYQSPL